ncbi:hypothetical protein IWX47DRAFT_901062 [Phyllosticta citricarpa]
MPADPDDFNYKSLRELRQRDPKDEHRDTMQSENSNSPGDPRIISRLRTLEDKNFDLQGQLSQIKEQLFQVQKQVKEFIDSKTEGQKRKMPEQDQATGTKRQRSTNALENQQQHKDATPTTKDPSSKRPGTIPPIPNPDISYVDCREIEIRQAYLFSHHKRGFDSGWVSPTVFPASGYHVESRTHYFETAGTVFCWLLLPRAWLG